MKFDNGDVDLSKVTDARDGRGAGRGRGPGLPQLNMGGAAPKTVGGALVMLVVAVLIGLLSQGGEAPTDSAYAAPDGAQGVAGSLAQRCPADAEDGVFDEPDCLLVKSFNEAGEVWSAYYAGSGQQRREPGLTFFDGSIRTACGSANTDVGPFYCPGDERIYFDLGFSRQLQQLGVQGQYAMVYIMAHEYGHHLQNVTGVERKVRRAQQADRRHANNYSVAMELQADCLAGAWGRMAHDQGNVVITPEEFAQASNAAGAVGDDRIMEGAGMKIQPERFTHGSAKQRQYWYRTGFESGSPQACNTFEQLGLQI